MLNFLPTFGLGVDLAIKLQCCKQSQGKVSFTFLSQLYSNLGTNFSTYFGFFPDLQRDFSNLVTFSNLNLISERKRTLYVFTTQITLVLKNSKNLSKYIEEILIFLSHVILLLGFIK